jgi:membrane fusion protein, adhesin transport system
MSRKSRSESGQYHRGDEAFLSGAKEAELAEATPGATWALYLMLAAVVLSIVWASVARVDEVTRVDGKVVPDGREQSISSLEGGILSKMLVREGDMVNAGQPLLQLDPTRVEAQENEGQIKRLALKATLARLESESTGRALMFPPEVAANQDVVSSETEAYLARRQALDDSVAVIQRSLGLLKRELAMSERMADRGLMSEVEVMRLRRQANDMFLQVQERTNRFRQDASSELVKVRAELGQLNEQMVVKQDVLKRTMLLSPVKGLVKNIKMNTVGGVVPAGAAIMEIVPIGPRVLVEARIRPKDVGFVRIGSNALVKLTAYDYYTYGGLSGTVEYLSPDALGEESKNASSSDTTYYRALIRSEVSTLKAKGKSLSVLPGMTATIEIRTGERSVLQFLLKPLLRTQEAFTER